MDGSDARLVLERVDALPSPSPLALRLLAAANDERSSARDLVELIRQDSALTAKVLSLCRRGPRGRTLDVASLDRAVVLLGFGAVRAAALAVEFIASSPTSDRAASSGFDAIRFWRHSLAKAIVAEQVARLAPGLACAGRAFVAGLLHDLGVLGLHAAAPALCDRWCEESERCPRAVDEGVARDLALTPAAIGVRLAERWNLPDELIAVLRLRGDAALACGDRNRGIVLACELADRFVRRRHVGGAGLGPTGAGVGPALEALGVDSARFHAATESLFEELSARAEALGIESPAACRLADEAIERASRRMERAPREPSGARAIEEIDAAGDTASLLSTIVRQLARLGGVTDRCLALVDGADGVHGEVREIAADGRILASRLTGDGDPAGARAVRRWCELRAPQGVPSRLALALRGRTLAVLHRADGEILPESARSRAPIDLWTLALAASVDREAARRATEALDAAHRDAAVARRRAEGLRVRAGIAEIACGLAHELNNPLALVSLRAQVLRRALPPAFAPQADEIVEASERASSLVTHLLRTVRPLAAQLRLCDAREVVDAAIALAGGTTDSVRVRVTDPAAQADPVACAADPAQLTDALAEVVQNALAASAATANAAPVEVIVERDPLRGRCRILVRDCGAGFSERALEHALEPFFSERPAGRGIGLGLARARALVEASGGTIELRNVVGESLTARTGEMRDGGTCGAEVSIALACDVDRARAARARRLGGAEPADGLREAA